MESEGNLEEERLTDDENDNDETDRTTAGDSRRGKTRHPKDVYLAEGVYSDCENILDKFLALKTSTFEDFVTLWREEKCSHIFDGRDTYAELLEFSEEVMAIAKSFILPPHSQIKRIGALYLMYGLYTQQPMQGYVKFRVTPQEWSVILKFVENLKALGFIDANYIFHKMSMDGAFLTVAINREFGLERNYRKYLMPWPEKDQELDPCLTFSLETLMSRVYRGSLKAAADKCRSKYTSIKQHLKNAAGSIFQGVEGTEKELEKVVQENIHAVIDISATHPETRKYSTIGLGRKGLKQKAFQLQSRQKNSQPAQDHPDASSSQLETQNVSLESQLSSENDSALSDFEYTMKPPSKRNSRRIVERKLKNREKKKKAKQLRSSGIHPHKAPYDEITECEPRSDFDFLLDSQSEEEFQDSSPEKPKKQKQKESQKLKKVSEKNNPSKPKQKKSQKSEKLLGENNPSKQKPKKSQKSVKVPQEKTPLKQKRGQCKPILPEEVKKPKQRRGQPSKPKSPETEKMNQPKPKRRRLSKAKNAEEAVNSIGDEPSTSCMSGVLL